MSTPKKVKAEVTNYTNIYNKVLLLSLKPQKRVPNFFPGQFLHLSIDEYDPSKPWPESRVFSIASSPEVRMETIDLLISKQGRYTKRIFSEVKLGQNIWLKLPYGDFTLNKKLGENNIFIAGGTGISPFLSILKSEISREQQLILYYGVTEDQFIFFEDFLIDKMQLDSCFKFEIFVEDGDSNNHKKGIIDIEYIYETNKSLESNYFIAGPQKMIDTFSNYLLRKNIMENKIIIDSWD